MSPALLLFLVRVAGAVLLLTFFATVAWFLFRDIRSTRKLMTDSRNDLGHLRVIASPNLIDLLDRRFELSPVTTIGRHSRNAIILDDNYVSGEHASLSWRDGQWWVQDLGSRNGTLLNGVPLAEPAVLSTGDVVTIGGIQLKLTLTETSHREERGV